MLNPAKASNAALLSAAQSYIDRKQYEKAEQMALSVLKKDIQDAAALAMMGELSVLQNKVNIVYYMMAIQQNPRELSYKERFIELGWKQQAETYQELTEFVLLECLRAGHAIDCTKLQMFWYSHLRLMPAFRQVCDLTGRQAFDPVNKDFFEKMSGFAPLLTPYFLLGLKYLVVSDALFEEFVTHLRKHLLEDFEENKKFTLSEHASLAAALAHYSFHTDYIFEDTEAEKTKVAALKVRVEGGDNTAACVALLACYMPLYKLKNANDVAAAFKSSPDMADLVQEQIVDYQALQEIAASVEAVTSIDAGISSQVREQYEEFPYPRWRTFSAKSLVRRWKETGEDGGIFNAFRGKKMKILVAGCGTGFEACLVASLFPSADVLAVDLSRSSLAYAIYKAKEYNIKNITFRQADILRLRELDQKFDYITSSGVLHHLQEPMKGWEVLCDLLKPDGVMMVALYSKKARWAVIQAQKIIREKGYQADAKGMKDCRRNSVQVLGAPILNNVSRFMDYYNLNMYRDLLFHVQEHDFDLLEIEKNLMELNLSFAGFNLAAKVMDDYARLYPDDAKKTDLKNWHDFEEKHPDTFQEMYYLWCRKK